jgi:hypothetical protein
MRSKLHLTDEEVMNKSWIALNLEMVDFPYYDYSAKKVIHDKDQANQILSKYMNHE